MTRPVLNADPRDAQRGRAVNSPPWPASRDRTPAPPLRSACWSPGWNARVRPPSRTRRWESSALNWLAVKREHLLAPVVGRRFLGGDVGRPVAHHLLGDAALNWQRATSSDFLFRKGLLPCEQVERRKGKRGGGTSLRSAPASAGAASGAASTHS